MNVFQLKPRVCFGENSLDALKDLKARNAVIFTDGFMYKSGTAERIAGYMTGCGQIKIFSEIKPDPPVELIADALRFLLDSNAELAVALGGGSVIDAAKATLWMYQKKTGNKLPLIALPTTSGTGSEVTQFSVITDRDLGMKYPLYSEDMLPEIAILSADAGENPTPAAIAKQVLRSPLLLLSLAGLLLNVTGAKDVLGQVGVMPMITEVTGFIAQPVSALMLFSVGFSLSLSEGNRSAIMRLSAIHFALLATAGLVMQGILCLLPAVEPETRWAILMYTTLPGSYIATTLGRTQEESEIASGVCSLLTIVSLVVFCIIAVCVA